MATFINNIVKFHTFSKSPVHGTLGLGGAVNPSGHTVVTGQVRADDIPWFIDTFQSSETAAKTWLAGNAKNPRHKDIAYYGADFKEGFTKPSCLIYVAKQEVDGKLVDLPKEQCRWEPFNLNAQTTLKNADEKDVIAIHKNCEVRFVDGDNNAKVNSNKNSVFVRTQDGRILDHFVAGTDKIYGGMPSKGYNAVVMVNGGAIDEGELDNNYIGNTFAGIIHFNKTRAEGDDTNKIITVNCFEYIGDKLDTSISNLRQSIKDISDVTLKGVVASVTADANTAQKAGITVDNSVTTTPVIKFTAGSVAANETKLVTGGAVKTYVDTTALAADGSIAKYIENYVATNAKVSVNGQSATTITVAGTEESSSDIVHIKITEDKTTTDKIGLKLTATIDEAVFDENGNLQQDGVVIATIAEKIADSAIKDAIETDNGAIQAAIDTAISGATLNSGTQGDNQIQNASTDAANKLVTAAQVKEYVTENAQVTVTVGSSKKTSTGFEFAGTTGTDIAVAPTMDANGKVTYAATLSKATVGTDGAITNGNLAVSATDAKTIADKAIESAIADGSTIDNRIDTVINTAIADGGVIDNRIDTLITNATSTSAIVDNDTSKKLVTAEQVATYVGSEVAAIDTGVTSISVNGGAAQKGAVSITALRGVGTETHTGVSAASINIREEGDEVKFTAISAGAQVSGDTLSYSRYSDYLATADDADVIATFRANEAKTALADTAITSQSVTGAGVSVTLGGKVGAPTLTGSVTPATYTSATKTWTNNTYFAKASDIATAISDAVGAIVIPTLSTTSTGVGLSASGHTVNIATANYTASTDAWTNKGYLVTGSTVEAYVTDVVSEVSSDLTALENKVNAYHEAGVSYKVHTGTTLPDLSVPANVENYKNVILLVPTSEGTNENGDKNAAITGSYVEWLCVNKGTKETPSWAWEQIGTTEADLHGYVNVISGGQAATLANQGSVYANISSTGYLTLGVASATSSVMGVSKMFTGDLAVTTQSNVTDTAVSVKSAQAMYSQLATLANSKISNVIAETYLSLAGFSVTTIGSSSSTERVIKAGVVSSANGSLQSAVANAKPKTVEGGILTSTDATNGLKHVIATDKIVDGTNMFATSTIETWVDDLSNMTNGTAMFKNSSLTVFVGDLSSLETADEMFMGCTLDAESLEILADTLPTVTSGTIDIGASTNATTEVIATIKGKKWTVKSNGTAL